jgi:hypothetical protein
VQGLRVYANADEGIHVSDGAHRNIIAYVDSWENQLEQIYALNNSGQILWYNRAMGGTTSIRFKNVSDSYLEGNEVSLTPAIFDDLSIRNTIVGGKIEQTLWRLRGIFPAIPSQNRFVGVHFYNPLGTCALFDSADGNVFEDSWFDCDTPDVACTGGGVNTFIRPQSGESGEIDGTCGFVVQRRKGMPTTRRYALQHIRASRWHTSSREASTQLWRSQLIRRRKPLVPNALTCAMVERRSGPEKGGDPYRLSSKTN